MGDGADDARAMELREAWAEDDAANFWTTKDGRVLAILSLNDEHLTNAIRMLESRGMRTPEEVAQSVIAQAEMRMSRFGSDMQKKYTRLLEERDRRALLTDQAKGET